jgi:FkbM family methyltransferase
MARVADLIAVRTAQIAERFASPILVRLNDRAKWWPLGCFPIRSGHNIKWIRVDSRIIHISVPNDERGRQESEFNHLYCDDPYRLATLPRGLRTVLDVGGNVGFFSIIARHYFPRALIHSYEPDPEIFLLLRKNTESIGVITHNAGIAARDGYADIVKSDCSLSTKLDTTAGGPIRVTSIKAAFDKLGDSIDLLKLDCEGGEWSILEDKETLRRAKYLAMEYHFTKDVSRSVWELVRLLKQEGFAIESLRESQVRVVGQLTAVNLAFA